MIDRTGRLPVLVLVGAALGAGLWIGRATALESQDRRAHPLEWDGHRWVNGFEAGEKLAFLGGFLAGAAASQVYPAETDSVLDLDEIAGRLEEFRRDRRLNFPFGPNLYHARLHDYYFYVDRLDRPLYRVMTELNFRLQREHY